MAKKLVIGIFVVVLIVFAFVHDWSHKQQLKVSDEKTASEQSRSPGTIHFEPNSPQLSSLMSEPVKLVPLPLAEPLNGRIAVDEDYTSRVSSPISGRIVELHGQPGDLVKQGMTLAVIDAPDLGAAQADLQKARADEQQKDLAWKRTRELVDGGVAARKELESAEAVLSQAKAETVRASLRISNLNPKAQTLSGQRMLLSAPVGGVVVDRRANPGMEARPDLADPLFVISDITHLQAIVDLPEQYLPKVAIGQPVTLTVDAWPDVVFQGRISRIAPSVDLGTRRIQVRCRIDNTDMKLKPDMYSRVTLVGDKDKLAMQIRNSALITEGLYSYVFVETDKGNFQKRRVQLSVQDREYSYVTAGLEQNDHVLTRGALLLNSQLSDGQ